MPKSVRIEIDPNGSDDIVIVCRELTPEILKIEQIINGGQFQSESDMLLTLGDSEYLIEYFDILFFETVGERTAAHTADRMYYTDRRLYELCDTLPKSFFRVSKSCIVNIESISSMKRELTGVCEISFRGSNKTAFVSRMYYKPFRERLAEIRLK